MNDIEALRKELGIDKWHVFGGSWGSTLALVYAEEYPERVKSLVVRGIFTFRQSELRWFYQDGTSHLFPEAWDDFLAPIPENERDDLLAGYHRALHSNDEALVKKAAKAWITWEMTTSRLYVDPGALKLIDTEGFIEGFAKIENHYFVNAGFMEEGHILSPVNTDKIPFSQKLECQTRHPNDHHQRSVRRLVPPQNSV